MFEYMQEHLGPILISSVLFVVGIMLGLICKVGDRGIFFVVSYPEGGEVLSIGTTTTNLSDIDLAKFGDAESHILIEKIRSLSVEGNVSRLLRDMVKESEGPFAKIPVRINLHFTDDNNISGPVAKACGNTPIYNNPVVAYDLEEKLSDAQIEGIMSLHAYWKHQNLSDCASENSDSYNVWVNKEHVESWLGPIDPLLTSILVKANIVVSSL